MNKQFLGKQNDVKEKGKGNESSRDQDQLLGVVKWPFY